jgi:opacity protein-like surface antigen
MKKFLLAAFVVAAISAPSTLAAPVNKVTVCHNTGSATNPVVIIEVSGAGALNGHTGPGHHQEGDDTGCFISEQ